MSEKEILSSFKNLENQKISKEVSLKETMKLIFLEYKKTSFTQRNFVEKLNKRNPHVNKILHELLEENFISRVGSNRKYYYSLKE